jgi:hypothetical protein
MEEQIIPFPRCVLDKDQYRAVADLTYCWKSPKTSEAVIPAKAG